MNIDKLLKEYSEISKKMVDDFNETDMIIIINKIKTRVFEKGREIKNIKSIEFSSSYNCVPEIVVERVIL